MQGVVAIHTNATVQMLGGGHDPLAALGGPGALEDDDGTRGAGRCGEADAGDLITSRILRLEGLEPGINQGPGCDSYERYIYFHGTNHEDQLGQAVSIGCIRMANADIIAVFDRVQDGDLVGLISIGDVVKARLEETRHETEALRAYIVAG